MALDAGSALRRLRAGNVPDDKARAAAEEVANYEGELTKLRLDMGERFRNGREGESRRPRMDDGLSARGRPGLFALQWQIL